MFPFKTQKVSLRQTVNEVLCAFDIEEESSSDENSALWIDAIQKCLNNSRRTKRTRRINIPSGLLDVMESSDSSVPSTPSEAPRRQRSTFSSTRHCDPTPSPQNNVSIESGESIEEATFSPAKSDTVLSSPVNDEELRRPRRIRLPPLEFWRGQRPIYRPLENGTFEFVKIELGSEVNRKTRKPAPSRKMPQTKGRKLFDLSCHVPLSESFIENSEKAKKELNTFLTKEQLNWEQIGSDWLIVSKNTDPSRSRGFIKILNKGEKPTQKTGHYESEFTLLSGKVSVTIGDNKPVILESLESFYVEPFCRYSIRNLRDEEAFLSFYAFLLKS